MQRILPVLSAVVVVLVLCVVAQAAEINSFDNHRAKLLCRDNEWAGIQAFTDSVWIVTSGASPDSFLIRVDSDTVKIYNDAGTCIARIDSTGTAYLSGPVGIGETYPDEKLHVSGGNVLLDNNQAIRIKDATPGYPRDVVKVDTGDNVNIGNSALAHIFFDAGGADNALVIEDTTGNVGIGTTSPGYKLEVAGSLNATDITEGGTPVLTEEADSVIGNEVLDAADATLIRSGIGTADSTYKLALNLDNDNTWTGVQTFTDSMWLKTSSSPADSFVIEVRDDTVRIRNDAGATIVRIDSAGTMYLRGPVGIGSTKPKIRLRVNDGILIPYNTYLASNVYWDVDRWRYATGWGYGNVIKMAGEFRFSTFGWSGGEDNAASPSEKVRIERAGNVGVGDQGPDANLEVSASGTTGGSALMVSATDAGNGNLFIVEESGNVGVGTTSFGTSAATVLGIGNGTKPTSQPDAMVQLYAADVDTGGGHFYSELFVLDELGNDTELSSHPTNYLNNRPDDGHPFPWGYKCSNPYLGKEIFVDLASVVADLEKLTGKTYMQVKEIPRRDWEANQQVIKAQRDAERTRLLEAKVEADEAMAEWEALPPEIREGTERPEEFITPIPEPYEPKPMPLWMRRILEAE